MCRLRFVAPEEAGPAARALFKKLVMVPNLFCIIANSEPVLGTFAGHQVNLGSFRLSARYREIVSLAVSQLNDCGYCLALHTSRAVEAGVLTRRECLEARRLHSPDPKTQALLRLTREILERRGKIGDAVLDRVRRRGFCDQEIMEAIAVIAFICMANFTANLAGPECDFLEAPPLDV